MKLDEKDLLLKINKFKEDGFKYQQRRHDDWKENYQLYRDKVTVNRLTQRQSVNVPLMKETIKTWLANIDDAPDLIFEELNNDKEKEIFKNEYWKHCAEDNNYEIKDIVDKKQVGLYGRSFQKLNIIDGKFYFEVLDPQDVLIDRYADPADIENTATCIIHQHIFRKLSDLERNPNYRAKVINDLKVFFVTPQGVQKASENAQSLVEKNQRLSEMGDTNVNTPGVGETYVELNESFLRLYDTETKEYQIILAVTANNRVLMSKPLKEILNVNFFPFITWADDVERTDIWSDGLADTVRTPNKVLNAWLSQLVENRTLRNFGMHYYDSTIEGFIPQTFEPAPFGWYPVPGKPSEVFQKVEIPDLSESLDEMQFVIDMAGRSTAITSVQKGESEKKQITLGEIKLLAAKSMERITSTAKFYRQARREFGQKWSELVDANVDKLTAVKLYKKSYKNNYFAKQIAPTDWKSEAGYRCVVRSSAEQEAETMDTIQKFAAIKAQFPMNQKLDEIYQKKLLDFIGLTPEESKEVLDAQTQMNNAPMSPTNSPPANLPINMPINQPVAA